MTISRTTRRPNDAQQYLEAQAEAERRRRQVAALDFGAFISRVNPRYQHYWHCRQLQAALQKVADGACQRLMVFMPPRHSKSETTSRLFPAYYLLRHPEVHVGLTSYSANLSYGFSRMARDYYRSAGGQVRGDAGAVHEWLTPQGGGLWATGVGGPMTGRGGKLLVIDDPLKDAEEAGSSLMRQKQKDWYSAVAQTRLEPGSAVVLVMCMTGDTPVLMADGTETPLRDINVGDYVATYNNGEIGVSKVLNHKSNGIDSIFKIKTISGKIARANARHPFLIEENGRLKWIRLKNLTTAHKIVTVKDSGESGRGKAALLKAANRPLSVEDTAGRITTKNFGRMDIDRHPSTQKPAEMRGSSIDTGLRAPSTMPWLRRRAASALFVGSPQETMYALTGAENSALTTATTQTPSEGSCATIATSPWDMPRQRQPHALLLSTSDFTTEAIASIEPDGTDEVFDVQIAYTENFIANGLVSHNTRWNEDDLAGWLLTLEEDEPEHWHIVSMPALAEAPEERPPLPPTCTVEPDPRAPGQALCEERYSAERLTKIRRRIKEYWFGSLYQQRPAPAGGGQFSKAHLPIVDLLPAQVQALIRYWDLGASASTRADYTVGVLMARLTSGTYAILDVVRGQWAEAERDRTIVQTAQRDRQRGSVTTYVEQAPGLAKEATDDIIRQLAGHTAYADRPSRDKVSRAGPLSSQAQAGNLLLLTGAWNPALVDEFTGFPNGRNDDQVDAASGAFNRLAELPALAAPEGVGETTDWGSV